MNNKSWFSAKSDRVPFICVHYGKGCRLALPYSSVIDIFKAPAGKVQITTPGYRVEIECVEPAKADADKESLPHEDAAANATPTEEQTVTAFLDALMNLTVSNIFDVPGVTTVSVYRLDAEGKVEPVAA